MQISLEGWQTLAIIVLPILYNRLKPLYQAAKSGEKRTSPPISKEVWRFRLFVACSAGAFFLSQLVFSTPRSVFQAVGLPFNAPTATLVERLVARTDAGVSSTGGSALSPNTILPDSLLSLITKLNTLQGRIIYQTVGALPLIECDVCADKFDYQLYAIPSVLLHYAITATFAGVLTIDNGRDKWRSWVGVALIGGFGADLCALFSEWDRNIFLPFYTHLGRNILGLLVITAAYFLQGESLPEPILAKQVLPIFEAIRNQMGRNANALSLLSITRAAIMRDPTLREQSTQFWEAIQREAEIAQADETLQKIAEEMQLGVDFVKEEDSDAKVRVDGAERASAKEWVKSQMSQIPQMHPHPPHHHHKHEKEIK